VSVARQFDAMTAHPAGGLGVAVAGEEVVCRPSGALWLPAHRTLIVADLHLEKGSFYATRGQLLPPYDTADTLRRLGAEVAALAPGRVVFLGDSFHDRDGEARLAGADVDGLGALVRGRELLWITGNHDPIGPRGLPGEAAATLGLGPLRRCFVTDGERLILPAFGALAGGLNVRDAAFRTLLGMRRLAAVLGAGRVHAVGWASLRDD